MTVPHGHPWPDRPARDATPDEIARVGNRRTTVIRNLAGANGWQIRTTYARGTLWGRSGKVVESIMLRMHRGPFWIAATWVEGKFYTGLLLAKDVSTVTSLNATEVAEMLKRKGTSDE